MALCDATVLVTAYADALGTATGYARTDARPEHLSRTGAEPHGAGQGCGAGQPNVCRAGGAERSLPAAITLGQLRLHA